MKRSYLATLTLSLSLLPAQGPAFVPKHQPLISIRADQVPTILKQWPETALGRLLADEDALHAAELGKRYTYNMIRRQHALTLAAGAIELPGDMQPHLASSIYRVQEFEIWRMLEQPAQEVQSVELTLHADPELGTRAYPRILRTMSCQPRFEGRWTQQFDDEAQARTKSRLFEPVEDAKIDGFPSYAFAVPERELANGRSMIAPQQWMLHLPGRFIYGCGIPEELGKIDAGPVRTDAEICLEMDLETFVEMFQKTGRGIPRDFQALGFDKLKRLKWSGHFAGELLVDVLDIELNGEPSGLVAAVLQSKAQPPAQELPKGALVQLRAAVDLETALTELAHIDNDFELPVGITKQVLAAFDGGFAIACCAPQLGGLIPRLFATVNIKDGKALDGLLAMLVSDELPVKKVKFGDVEVTTLKIPGAPQGLQPAWCRVGDKLHIAESARSMRSFLKAQKGDAVAMDVDEMEAPAGAGELLTNIDLRYDGAAIYESFYELWLPLFEISGASDLPAPVRRRDLPEPDIVAEFLGKGRGVLRRDGDRYSLIQQSATGGLETTALLFTWSTMLSQQMTDWTIEQYSLMVARTKLEKVYEKLERFKNREQRWPKDLAELYTAEQLPDDALLMPADDLAEQVTLQGGRVVRSSFRYFPAPVQINGLRGAQEMLLIEVRPHRSNRAILDVSGTMPDWYGSESRWPIDQFGKGSSSFNTPVPVDAGREDR